MDRRCNYQENNDKKYLKERMKQWIRFRMKRRLGKVKEYNKEMFKKKTKKAKERKKENRCRTK